MTSIEVVSDTGPFSIVPHWLIDAGASPQAVTLYAVLGMYADNQSGECWPSRAALARRVGKSRDSIDRWLTELRTLGAVSWTQRQGPSGDPNQSNVYTLCRIRAAEGCRDNAAGGAAPTRHRTTPSRTRPRERGAAADLMTDADYDEALK
jgi:hypothetical protein